MSVADLATRAVRKAGLVRSELKLGPTDSLCPLDAAEKLGVLVRLAAIPSLEGVYARGDTSLVILNAQRPPGRRRHTCAHELGHHFFGHGVCLDQNSGLTSGWNPEEFTADRFATALLMPKLAVLSSITRRGWTADALTPTQVLVLAQDLGVSYTNLINHMTRTLRLITVDHGAVLRRAGVNLRRLRFELAGFQTKNDLIVVDRWWGARAVDAEVGDIVLLPQEGEFVGSCLTRFSHPTPHLRATATGCGSLALAPDRNPVSVRVSRRDFVGLARYRHLEEPENGN